jgi:hypothetical protein
MLRLKRILLSALVIGAAASSELLAQADWELLGTRKVSLAKETDVIEVARRDGRFDAIRVEVDNGPIELHDVQVVFTNGETFSPTTRISFTENDRTRVIDLPGNTRTIQRIGFRYRGPLRLGAATLKVYGRQAVANQPPRSVAETPRSPSADGWVHIGAREVDFRRETDAIRAEGERGFNTILLAVEGADVEISNVVVNFANGEHFRPEVRLVFEENSRSRFIDLPGNARDIRNIEFRYRTLRGANNGNKAIIHVYGKSEERGRGRSPTEEGWVHIGAQQVDFRREADAVRAEGAARFNTILIAVEGADVEISNLVVNFANGQHFRPDLRLVFERNTRSRMIDLPGTARDIRNIEFRYRTLREGNGNNKAIVHVYGKLENRSR